MDRTVVLGGTFLLVGVAILTAGGYSAARSAWFECRAARAQGTVVELMRISGEEGFTYAPRVRYVTPSGVERTFLADTSTGWRGYELGDAVTVLYDPESSEARIRSFLHLWSGAAFLLGLGLAFAGFGTATIRRRNPSPDRRASSTA